MSRSTDDFVVAAGLLKSALEIFARINLIAGEPFLIGAGDPRGRSEEAFAVRSSPAQRMSVRTAASASAATAWRTADAGRFAGAAD